MTSSVFTGQERDKTSYLDTLIQNSWDGILVVDAEGRFEYGNPAFFRIFGWKPEDLIGEIFFKVIPDDLHDYMAEKWEEVQRGEGQPYETEIFSSEGRRIPLKVTHRHMDVDGVRKYCVIVHDNTEQKAREAELEAYRTRLEDMVEQRTRALKKTDALLRRATEERKELEINISRMERDRIGRDFHDALGQNLTGLGFFCKALQMTLEKEQSPHSDDAKKITAMVKDIICVARRIAHGLSPVDIPEDGLPDALAQLACDTQGACNVQCSFEENGNVSIRDQAIATHLYRIAQEGVNNALKHASPSRIDIQLTVDADRGVLTVTNDGVPIPEEQEGDGIGLRIMRHRASILQGSLKLVPGEHGGSVLSCSFANLAPAEARAAGISAGSVQPSS